MVTIKSHTDLGQSQRLAKILPLESADMCYGYIAPYEFSDRSYEGGYDEIPYPKDFLKKNPNFSENEYDGKHPCWSLAALLDEMPKDKSIDCAISFGYYNGKGEYIEKWICSFEKEGETTDDFIIETTDGDNPIDACYEMILKLHEQNLI